MSLFNRSTIAASLALAPPLLFSMSTNAARAAEAAAHPEARPFEEKALAAAQVDAAIARANAADRMVLIVIGANWCHDSRALAGWFATPRFAPMLSAKYELVYVNVGSPQTGKPRNLDVAQRYGIAKIKGTPTVLILSKDGVLLNRKDAPSWRNAASRTGDQIFESFNGFSASRQTGSKP